MSADLTELYQQVILDHNRRPRNRGRLPTANRVAHGDNPSCGDQCSVYLQLDGDRIKDISFDGSGCAISMASASLMTTQLKGKTAAEAEALYERLEQEVIPEFYARNEERSTRNSTRSSPPARSPGRSATSPRSPACTPSLRASSAPPSAGTPRLTR